MLRVLGVTGAAKICAVAFVAYKLVEIGPYEAALLFGRCVRVFIVAVQGFA